LAARLFAPAADALLARFSLPAARLAAVFRPPWPSAFGAGVLRRPLCGLGALAAPPAWRKASSSPFRRAALFRHSRFLSPLRSSVTGSVDVDESP
jgi:hypothetical protein